MALLDLLKFVTTGTWGTGLARPLTAAECDTNIYSLADAIQDLIDNPVAGVELTNIVVTGSQVVFYMSDATTRGPFTLPIAYPRFRDEWQASTSYAAMDIITAAGYGTYLVLLDHTSGLAFDPNDGNSAGDYYVQIANDTTILTGQVKPLIEFRPADNEAPASNPATLDSRNGRPVLDFDDTTQETAIFSGILPLSYSGNGLTVETFWGATSATTGTVGWDVAFESVEVGFLDTDTDSFATAMSILATTVPTTSGQIKKTSVTFNNAQIDGIDGGSFFRLRIRRDVATDSATGDAELFRVVVRET